MKDISKQEDVKQFVDGFYLRVQADSLLGPVFGSRINDWGPHLNRMCDFWSSILLGTGAYRGQPFPKHLGLGIGAAHFERWLGLFEENMNSQFQGPRAIEAVQRAKTIAEIFKGKIAFIEANDKG